MNDLKKLIREVPDYPKPGILFYDLTTLLKDKRGFHTLIDRLCEHYDGHTIDVVAGVEERGVIFSPAPAHPLGGGVLVGREAGRGRGGESGGGGSFKKKKKKNRIL